jgi:hypothetical protein
MIRVETATVYVGGRRRWLTRRAAERAEAKAIIRKRCECSRPDALFGDPGYTCVYHHDPVRLQRIIHLLVVMFVRPCRDKDPSR